MEEHKEIFLVEAEELLAELEDALLELQTHPTDLEVVDQVLHSLHTLKGSGAMFGLTEIAEFTYQVESVYLQIRAGQLAVTPELLELSLAARDQLRLMVASEEGEWGWSDPGEEGRILFALGRLRFTPAPPAEAQGTAVL